MKNNATLSEGRILLKSFHQFNAVTCLIDNLFYLVIFVSNSFTIDTGKREERG